MHRVYPFYPEFTNACQFFFILPHVAKEHDEKRMEVAKEYASERPEDRSTDESAALCNAGTSLWETAFLIAVPETR